MLRNRDEEIRAIAPYVMRATKCNRETAILFLCSLSRAERRVIYKLRAVAQLNRPVRKRTKSHAAAAAYHELAWSDELAWSKPR